MKTLLLAVGVAVIAAAIGAGTTSSFKERQARESFPVIVRTVTLDDVGTTVMREEYVHSNSAAQYTREIINRRDYINPDAVFVCRIIDHGHAYHVDSVCDSKYESFEYLDYRRNSDSTDFSRGDLTVLRARS